MEAWITRKGLVRYSIVTTFQEADIWLKSADMSVLRWMVNNSSGKGAFIATTEYCFTCEELLALLKLVPSTEFADEHRDDVKEQLIKGVLLHRTRQVCI